MKIKNVAYATFVAAVAVAFIIGSAVPSEAAKKKKKEAAAAPQPATCWVTAPGPVCATKGGQKFTYQNTCWAMKDQATSAKAGACKVAKAKKGGGKKKMASKKKT
jgi:hypothetical protein